MEAGTSKGRYFHISHQAHISSSLCLLSLSSSLRLRVQAFGIIGPLDWCPLTSQIFYLQSVLQLNTLSRALMLLCRLSVALHGPVAYSKADTLTPTFWSHPALPPASNPPPPSCQWAARSFPHCPFQRLSTLECLLPPPKLALPVQRDCASRARIKVTSFKKSPEKVYRMAPVGRRLCWTLRIQQ